MSSDNFDSETKESASEYLRLSLAKLSHYKLPVNPVNYALMYFYVSGQDIALNQRLDAMFSDIENWTHDAAKQLFIRFICQCSDHEYQQLREELLMTVAQIIGFVIDMSGKAALSNSKLEKHIEHLGATHEPREILTIASSIIADTREFIEQSRDFENNLAESTQEISFLKTELDQARRMATTDSLTGLHNRRGFDQALVNQMERNESRRENFCLLILDIDHFKQVNDSHGHLVGDKVLIGIAKILQQHMRGNDHLSRFGGEEFAILLLDTPITGAFTVAENLRKSVEKLRLKQIKTGLELGQITISIGVAAYRRAEPMGEFIQRCDKALYRAKSLGRNRTVLAD